MEKILNLLPDIKKYYPSSLVSNSLTIFVAGFEERCKALINSLPVGVNSHALLLEYLPFDEKNRKDEMINLLEDKGFQINILKYDRFSPEEFTEKFKYFIFKLNPREVLIDVSAMSKLAVFQILMILKKINLKVSIHYAEAKEYGPTEEKYQKARNDKAYFRPSIQIYTGVHGVTRISELSSVAMQGQPTAAIVFNSFNEKLTQALINSVYPSKLFLINSRPPTLRWREEATAWIHEQLRGEWPDFDNPIDKSTGMPLRTVSTLFYKETVQSLLELYLNLSIDHRILVAPTGSKMQTIGCFVVKAIHPDVHIEYPTPEGFLDLYSVGIGDQWYLEFGVLGDLLETLRAKEKENILSILG